MSGSESPVIIAISSELLFEPQRMSPGPVFSFVKALKAANATIKERFPESEAAFKVILLTDNSSDKLDDAIKSHELNELVYCFPVRGDNLINELKKNKAHLYLSAKPGFKIQEAVNEDIAAAVVFAPEKNIPQESEAPLRVVFDGDAVLFSDESEKLNKQSLQNFLENERTNVNKSMTEGPFKGFLEALFNLQKKFHDKHLKCPIRTYLLTARNAGNAGYRALNTLKTWGLHMDEAYFLNGSPKGPLLNVISPHIFFDDGMKHVKDAAEEGKLACHVPYCKSNP